MWFALCVTILVVGEGRSLAQSTRRSESSGLLRHPRRTTARICCMCKSLLFRFINSAAALIDFLLLRVCLKEELELLSVLWTYPAVGGCTDTGPLKLAADLHHCLRPPAASPRLITQIHLLL